MRWRSFVTAAAVVLIGCAGAAPSLPLATPTPQPNSAASPAATTVTVRTSEPTSTVPAPEITEQERSDTYWSAISKFGMYSFVYESLREITEDAHLVVLGRVVDVKLGTLQSFESPDGIESSMPVIFGVVAVDEVLKGQPEMRVPGQVLVARMGLTGMTAADLPSGQVILFLKNYAQLRAEGGYEVSPDAADRFYYARPNGYQCVLRDVGGRVRIVDGPPGWEEAIGPFPSQLDGRRFADVVERVRTLADDA